jgi:hypothetical protein
MFSFIKDEGYGLENDQIPNLRPRCPKLRLGITPKPASMAPSPTLLEMGWPERLCWLPNLRRPNLRPRRPNLRPPQTCAPPVLKRSETRPLGCQVGAPTCARAAQTFALPKPAQRVAPRALRVALLGSALAPPRAREALLRLPESKFWLSPKSVKNAILWTAKALTKAN